VGHVILAPHPALPVQILLPMLVQVAILEPTCQEANAYHAAQIA